MLSEVFRCMHKAGLWRRSALPARLRALEPVPSIFHNGGGRGGRGREACSANGRRASHPSAEEPLRVGRPGPRLWKPCVPRSCDGPCTLPRALLKESRGHLTDHCKAPGRPNPGGGRAGRGGQRGDPHLHSQPQPSRRGGTAGRAFELGRAGLDSVKLGK